MSVDPLEDAIRPVVQKLITESVKSPDSVTLKVYDDALDRVVRYLRFFADRAAKKWPLRAV
jgi:hypothetical protein